MQNLRNKDEIKIKVNTLKHQIKELRAEIRKIEKKIKILNDANRIIGGLPDYFYDNLTDNFNSSEFKKDVRPLVLQVLIEADKPLLTREIVEKSFALYNPNADRKYTDKEYKAIRNIVTSLITKGDVKMVENKETWNKYQYCGNKESK